MKPGGNQSPQHGEVVVSKFLTAARSTLIAGACAVLFVSSMAGMRQLNLMESKAPDFASWQLRGAIAVE
ncbi:hypothetical protein [Rhizobium sp. 18055]|uniref:hypothetical protein n=1 Tax=Rhizobium sp. 18055 TaxID=2681403 RepID=UPI001358961A|nr:hypothetical protein [Rhizobium sp. 18055]